MDLRNSHLKEVPGGRVDTSLDELYFLVRKVPDSPNSCGGVLVLFENML
jgi:hypothetical protein